MELSVVIPLYNEEESVPYLAERIKQSLVGFEYEIIWVDDGSQDQTRNQIKKHSDHRTKLICLSRNFGQTAALSAGIEAAEGTYIVTLDGDLQNNPEDIPMMLAKLQDGDWDVVTGFRKSRKDNLVRLIPSWVANRMIRWISGNAIRDYGCSLKVFKGATAKNLQLYGELHRFIPIMVVMQGGSITEVDVSHAPRKFGKSKYGLGRTTRVLSDLFLLFFFQKYLKRPIHFFGPLGMITLIAGMAINAYLLVIKIQGHEIGGRPLINLGVLLVLIGIQFLTFGLIAELMMRIYYESQNKKIYLIKEVFIGKDQAQ